MKHCTSGDRPEGGEVRLQGPGEQVVVGGRGRIRRDIQSFPSQLGLLREFAHAFIVLHPQAKSWSIRDMKLPMNHVYNREGV